MVRLVSDSAEFDAAILALADGVKLGNKAKTWRVVGGHMVNLHILRSGLSLPPRVTHDTDLALNLTGFRMRRFIHHMRELGYDNPTFSNRFERPYGDSVISIDVLIPSYSTKHVPNIDVGVIGIDGMPFLDIALERDPVIVDLIAEQTNGTTFELRVQIPDLVTAIAIKTFAIAERSNVKDAEDIGNLLEIVAEGTAGGTWLSGPAFVMAGRQLQAQFDTPGIALPDASPDQERRQRLREITRELLGGHARATASVY